MQSLQKYLKNIFILKKTKNRIFEDLGVDSKIISVKENSTYYINLCTCILMQCF